MRARRFLPTVDRLDLRITPSDLVPIAVAGPSLGVPVMEAVGTNLFPDGPGLMPGETNDCTSAWLVAGDAPLGGQVTLEPPVESSFMAVMPVGVVATH